MKFRWLIALAGFATLATAQSRQIYGDYAGVLGPLHLKLHLKRASGGAIEGTLDSPDQGAIAIACADVELKDASLSFTVPAVGGKWRGTVSPDGATLTGTWSQNGPDQLVFHREEPFLPAAKPSPVDGIWLGTISAGGAKLRLQVQVKSDRAGKEYCSVDSLDQGVAAIPCDKVLLQADHFSFDVPSVHGHWSGTLSKDGAQLSGTWSQGSPLALNLTRQTSALAPERPKPPKYDAAMAPLSGDALKAALDRDLAGALAHGALAPSTGGGVVIGVLDHGARQILVYGQANKDSIFEIGSISKTFTALILARMVEQNKVKLDEPVRELLPPGTVAKPAGEEITLLDLADQHSGLPRMPDNFHPADPQNPYADYGPKQLYEYIAKHGVAKPADAEFLYSNLGLGLLGQALSDRAGVPYPELLQREVTGPLHMPDTVVKLSPQQTARFIQGHDAQHRPAHPWDLDALAGAGAIRSTANDMLTYLDAQLHPEATSIAPALELCHQLHAGVAPGVRIALAWLHDTKTGNYWHNGGTGGYTSYAFFNPKDDDAAVVLFNTTLGPGGSFADRLGEHIAERLSGRPAVSLGE